MTQLTKRAFRGLAVTLIAIGILLFVAAGTLAFWQAWLFLVVFGLTSLAITMYLMKNDPALLERRVRGGPGAEKETSQKIIMMIASASFAAIFLVAGLDRRFGWSEVPTYLVVLGNVAVVAGWLGIFFVFKENTYTSSTIELAAGQRVISTGPYAVVRHPMYGASIAYLAGIPIALGSWWALLAVLSMIPVLVWRLLDEERFLARNLDGYAGYMDRVKRRMVPGVW
jgi:protein-S-isoprenylcysteine O-methyltransferase Ste14